MEDLQMEQYLKYQKCSKNIWNAYTSSEFVLCIAKEFIGHIKTDFLHSQTNYAFRHYNPQSGCTFYSWCAFQSIIRLKGNKV